jgi:hypothetical protein
MKLSLPTIAAAACASLAVASATANVLSFALPERLTLNEPVLAEISSINDSENPVHIALGWSGVQYLQFEVVNDGNRMAITRPMPP